MIFIGPTMLRGLRVAPSHSLRLTARGLVVTGLLLVSAALTAGMGADPEETWDRLWDQARKVIDNNASSDAALDVAIGKLRRVVEMEDRKAPGKKMNMELRAFVTNFSENFAYLPHMYLGWALYRRGVYDEAYDALKKSAEQRYLRQNGPNDELIACTKRQELLEILEARRGLLSAIGEVKGGDAASCPSNGATLTSRVSTARSETQNPKMTAHGLREWEREVRDALNSCRQEAGSNDESARDRFSRAAEPLKARSLGEALPEELRTKVAAQLKDPPEGSASAINSRTSGLIALWSEVRTNLVVQKAAALERARALQGRNKGFLAAQPPKASLPARIQDLEGRSVSEGGTGKKDVEDFLKSFTELTSSCEATSQLIADTVRQREQPLRDAKERLAALRASRGCEIQLLHLDPNISTTLQFADNTLSLKDSVDDMTSATERLIAVRNNVQAKTLEWRGNALAHARDALQSLTIAIQEKKVPPACPNPENLRVTLTSAIAAERACDAWASSETVDSQCRADLTKLLQQLAAEGTKFVQDAKRITNCCAAVLPPADQSRLSERIDAVILEPTAAQIGPAQAALKALTDEVTSISSTIDSRWKAARRSVEQIKTRKSCLGDIDANREAKVRAAAKEIDPNALWNSKPNAIYALLNDAPALEAEIEVRCAYAGFFETGDPNTALSRLLPLGPEREKGSPLLAYSMAYFHWEKARRSVGAEVDREIQQSRERFRAAEARFGPPGEGLKSLFSPDFVSLRGGLSRGGAPDKASAGTPGPRS